MNLPNSLTLLRILLVPGILVAIIEHRWGIALAIFSLAGLTDFLDGFLARQLDQKTTLGQYLDPIADKLLVAVAYTALAVQGVLPAWLAVLVVFRDIFIALGAAILFLLGEDVRSVPTRWGKHTTFWQLTVIVVVLAKACGFFPGDFLIYPFTAAGIMTLLSGCVYLRNGLRSLPPEYRGGGPGVCS